MKYIAKKAAAMLVTLFVISLLAFLAFEVIPGDPTTKMLGTDWTPERAAALRAELGLTSPLPLRYLRWLGGFFGGDLGTSYSYSQPVRELLAGKIGITAALSAMGQQGKDLQLSYLDDGSTDMLTTQWTVRERT